MPRPKDREKIKNTSKKPIDIYPNLVDRQVNTLNGKVREVWKTNSIIRWIIYRIVIFIYSKILLFIPTITVFLYLWTRTTMSLLIVISITFSVFIISIFFFIKFINIYQKIKRKIQKIGYDTITYTDDEYT